MMLWVGIGVLVLLAWAWWFDHYRRRPRRGPGAIDDTALEKDRSAASQQNVHRFNHEHYGGGGGFGG